MEFNEFLNYSKVLDEYPILKKIAYNKFYSFDDLYTPSTMERLITGILESNNLNILKNETLLKNAIMCLDPKSWGTTGIIKSFSESNAEGSNTIGYKGFNAEGDFQTDTSNGKNNQSDNSNTISVNNLEVFLSLNSIELEELFKKELKEIGKLLQINYSIGGING